MWPCDLRWYSSRTVFRLNIFAFDFLRVLILTSAIFMAMAHVDGRAIFLHTKWTCFPSLCIVSFRVSFFFFVSLVWCGPNAQISNYNWCHDDHKNGDTDQNANLFLYFSFLEPQPTNSFSWWWENLCLCVCVNIYKKKKNGNLIIQFGRQNKSFLNHIKEKPTTKNTRIVNVIFFFLVKL